MNKKEITAKMALDAGLTHIQAERAFLSLVAGIKSSLKKGKRVTFSGLGSFEVIWRMPRKGRNPKTGEVIEIPKRKRIRFNASRKLKKLI
jgi:DNA-binding protein HU-beta